MAGGGRAEGIQFGFEIQNSSSISSSCNKMSQMYGLVPQLKPKVPVHLVSVLHPFDRQGLVLRCLRRLLTCPAQEILLVSSLPYNRYAKDCL